MNTLIALHASRYATEHGSQASSGIFDMISRWVAHAAVWRIMDHLPLVLVAVVGIAAVALMAYRARRRSRARD